MNPVTFKELKDNNAACEICTVDEDLRTLRNAECLICYSIYAKDFDEHNRKVADE